MPQEVGDLDRARWSPPAAGDRDAFDELVRATYADTYTLAYRLTGDEEDARDVVQEAYLRAYRGLKRFRGDAQFSTWLYRITANCAATHLGRRRRHRHEELDRRRAARRHGPGRRPRGSADARADPRRLTRRLREPAAPAAGRGRPPRHVRPAPRGDRRRARHLRVGGQGAAAPGPAQAARGPVPRRREAARRGADARAV